MSDYASEDLFWLSNRLKGLLSLSEEVKNYEDMKNKSKDLEATSDTKRQELTELVQKIKDAEKQKDDLSKGIDVLVKEAKAEAKEIVAKAKVDAEALRSKVQLELEDVKQASFIEKMAIEDQIAKANTELKSIDVLITDKSKVLSLITKQIEDLKAKF